MSLSPGCIYIYPTGSQNTLLLHIPHLLHSNSVVLYFEWLLGEVSVNKKKYQYLIKKNEPNMHSTKFTALSNKKWNN